MEKLIKLVREGYDRNKLVNKIVKPIKDKEKMFPKSKKEASGDKEEYQKFFNAAMKKFGVKSPAELKGDKEKEFYNYIDKNWKGDHEESVELALEFGTPNMSDADKANLRRRIKDMQKSKKKESVDEARKEPFIPFAKGDAFITKDRDPETGRGEFYNVRSDDFKIVKTFKTMKDAEKFLDRMNKESVEEARKEPFIPFAKNSAFITKDRDAETGRRDYYNVRDGDSFKVIKTFKTMKDAEKFLDKQVSEEVVKESIGHVGTNGQGLEADEQGRGLSPKAQFVKSMMNPEVAADANKTALQTFAAIMNSVSAKGAPRSGDNTEQDLPEAKQVTTEAVGAVGPFVFSKNDSDDELLNMYHAAVDAYSSGYRLMHPKSDYKKAITQIKNILKKRGVDTDNRPIGKDDPAMLAYRAALSKN